MDNQEGAPAPTGESQGMEPKTVAIISYLTLIGFIIALVINSSNKSNFASFHIRQMLGLVACSFALGICNFVPILGQIVWVVGSIILFVLWIIGFMGALNNEEKVVPILGDKFQEWIKGL